jgi:hypothetical protein
MKKTLFEGTISKLHELDMSGLLNGLRATIVSEDPLIRAQAAKNLFAVSHFPTLVGKLADDPDPKVRRSLAGNMLAVVQCRDAILQLCEDQDPGVRRALLGNPYFFDLPQENRLGLIRQCSEEEAMELARDHQFLLLNPQLALPFLKNPKLSSLIPDFIQRFLLREQIAS